MQLHFLCGGASIADDVKKCYMAYLEKGDYLPGK